MTVASASPITPPVADATVAKTGARLVVEALEREGVTTVFG